MNHQDGMLYARLGSVCSIETMQANFLAIHRYIKFYLDSMSHLFKTSLVVLVISLFHSLLTEKKVDEI